MTRRMLLVCIGVGIAALGAPAVVQMQARVVYNPTDSVARGWYWIGPSDALHVGSVVLVRLPDGVATFAAQRGYLPASVPLLKRVGAVAPQVVCVRHGVVHFDSVAVAAVRMHDSAHRPMPFWTQCRPLVSGEMFLLSNTNPASFDSRYFGPLNPSAVIGSAQPLWTWGAP